MKPRIKRIVVHTYMLLEKREDWGRQCERARDRLLRAWAFKDLTLARAIHWHRRNCTFCRNIKREF